MRKSIFKKFVFIVIISAFFVNGILNAAPKKKTVLVHFVADIKKDDGPPCVAFDMAFANIMMGNKVVMLFDADASWNLKLFEKDNKNDFDRYEIPADLKKLIYEQFKDNSLKKLKSFGDFLSYMKSKGAEIYVNGTWNVLTSVEKTIKGKTKMPSYVTPLTLKEMAKEINSADSYMRY